MRLILKTNFMADTSTPNLITATHGAALRMNLIIMLVFIILALGASVAALVLYAQLDGEVKHMHAHPDGVTGLRNRMNNKKR